MAKNIVFCADGTWNNPNEDQDDDHRADPTNVFKLFLNLDGASSPLSLREADEQEKDLVESGVSRQVAKYIHGVGDTRNPIRRIVGGAFGAGTISRIVRGYTFISRNYEPGADIYIVGFSRGAYTARALAGLIASQGVLAPELTVDKEAAYRRGAQVWYRYRKAALEKVKARGSLARLAEIASDLPAFLSRGNVKDDDLIPVDHIAAVGVWDTVGSLGIPSYVGGGLADRVDAFRFADL
jgi:glutathione S-transferase